jgi:methyl-accepting chemotaxis protein
MRNLSLSAKITSIICLFVVASAVISYKGIDSVAKVNDLLKNVTGILIRRIDFAQETRAYFRLLVLEEKNLIALKSLEDKNKAKKNIESIKSDLYKTLDNWREIAPESNKKKMDKMKEIVAKWIDNDAKVEKLVFDGKTESAADLSFGVSRGLSGELEEIVGGIINFNKKLMEESSIEAERSYISSRNIMIAVSVISVLIGCIIAYFVLKAMTGMINKIIASLSENSSQVSSSAQQIASSSEQLSQSTVEQASSLEETASSIEEMNSTIRMSAENARKSKQISDGSHESVVKGKQVVQSMIQTIGEIDSGNQVFVEEIKVSNQKIAEIINMISEIGNKTKIINDIVFQTKLLSFNASVEAARAGEHGKGFAVVAEEVGNLAQMSGNAAKDISVMLEDSTQKVGMIVNEAREKLEKMAQEGRGRISEGTKIAQQCGSVLDEIVTSVANVAQITDSIASACQEQAQGIQEINKAVAQLDQTTQQNASASEQTASSAEELSSQADSLNGIVKLLSVTIRGGTHEGTSLETLHSGVSKNSKFVENQQVNKNVIQFKAKEPRPVVKKIEHVTEPKVAGLKFDTPSEDDPRFKDI